VYKVTYPAVNFLFCVFYDASIVFVFVVRFLRKFYVKDEYLFCLEKGTESFRDLCVRWSFGRCFIEGAKVLSRGYPYMPHTDCRVADLVIIELLKCGVSVR
jgi:hypothetical protein